MSISELVGNFISTLFSNFMLNLLVFIILLRFESYFGIYEQIKRFVFLTFKKIHIILSVDYHSNICVNDTIDIIKNEFKNSYGKSSVDMRHINDDFFDFFVSNEFDVTVQKNVNDLITIRTSKITSTKSDIKNDIKRFLNTLREIEVQLKGNHYEFSPKSFSVFLSVPYIGTYMKFYEPKGLKMKKYVIELEEIQKTNNGNISTEKSSTEKPNSVKYDIKLVGDIININSNYRDQISELIDKFV
jgi:hypothetical protein